MNYQLLYNKLIERGQLRIKPEGYSEKHHIIPLCMEGKNDKENIVSLTAREHFLCHWLLIRIYPTNYKLSQAFWLMAIGKLKPKENLHLPSSRAYQEAKENFSKNQTGKGFPIYQLEPTTLVIIKEWPSSIIASKFFKADINGCLKGNQITAGGFKWKYKNKFTPECKIKPYILKKIIQKDLKTNEIIKIWNNASQIYKELKICVDSCVRGKDRYAGGFKWEYLI